MLFSEPAEAKVAGLEEAAKCRSPGAKEDCMPPIPVLLDLTPETIDSLPCCGVKSATHEGRRLKNCWLKVHFKKGLRAKVLMTPDNRQCGYIEYLPGVHAWRAVNAAGYMFIHCVWTFFKQYQHKGAASRMVQAVVEEARHAGMKGVAVLAREGPFAASSALFLKNGFEVVDTAPPDCQLLVRKLHPTAPNPAFKGQWEAKLKRYGRGLTIIRSDQCPGFAKFATEITRAAKEDYGLKPRMVELKSAHEAQNAPTPYAVFAVIYNGRLLADHQISCSRFHNIMRKLKAQGCL